MGCNSPYHHLSEAKRGQIMALANMGLSQRLIAVETGVSQSTISRELSRHFEGGMPLSTRIMKYDAHKAQISYGKHRESCKPHGKFSKEVVDIAEKYVLKGYSPEQVSNTVLPEISYVTLYRWLYRGFLFYGDKTVLRHKGKKRIKRKNNQAKKYKVGKSIHTRPEEIDSRAEFGHFEADSVESGRDGHGCVFTLVERTTRKVYGFVSSECTADAFMHAVLSLASKLPQGALKSITADRGKEFANYAQIEKKLGIPFYFADPHSPWQKGTNENSNGLIREYFPKGTDFSKVSQRDLYYKAINKINTRPRKVLNWKSANECFGINIAGLKNDALEM
ncbi:MAG: IS30 family transposase [Desulfovibrio sp.]|nr:IS30 family transposase [Desulfovibrio sp.]